MQEFRLSESDRERFGIDEWLSFNPYAISIGDLEELSERFDFEVEDWPEPYTGRLTLEQAGDPDARPKPPRWQYHAGVWMMLRQAGRDVTWEEVGTVRFFQMESRDTSGKDPGASDGSEPSTTQPSESSSTSRKRK